MRITATFIDKICPLQQVIQMSTYPFFILRHRFPHSTCSGCCSCHRVAGLLDFWSIFLLPNEKRSLVPFGCVRILFLLRFLIFTIFSFCDRLVLLSVRFTLFLFLFCLFGLLWRWMINEIIGNSTARAFTIVLFFWFTSRALRWAFLSPFLI